MPCNRGSRWPGIRNTMAQRLGIKRAPYSEHELARGHPRPRRIGSARPRMLELDMPRSGQCSHAELEPLTRELIDERAWRN